MSRHQKRVTIPLSWPISRKTSKWVVKARPGPHSAENSIPLTLVVRDMLKLADNTREVVRVLHEGAVLVNGVVRKDYKFPVGLFDIITLPSINKNYRMVVGRKGVFALNPIEASDAVKLSRIENKTVLKGGRIQVNLNDGTNMMASGDYSTRDSVILSIPDKKVIDVIKFEVGNLAFVSGGTHVGRVGAIKDIIMTRGSGPNRVIISGEDEFETIDNYVFMVGKGQAAINLEAPK